MLYSNNLVFYSCLGDDKFFFKNISLLNIIIDDKITSKDPINVLVVGISLQIKNPNIIAKTKAKYFNGVTRDTVNNTLTANEVEVNGSLTLNGGLDISFSNMELYGGLTVFGNTNMWNIADSEATTQSSDINNLRVKNIYSLGGNEFFTDFDPETAATLPDINTLKAAIDPSVNNVFAGSTLFLKDTIKHCLISNGKLDTINY